MGHIVGASVWEQELYDYVNDHVATEGAILGEYATLANDPETSPAFRYLARLILDDERRHHAIFNDLAESIRQMGEMRTSDDPIPSVRGLRRDRDRILEMTEHLLRTEHDDAKMLKQLDKKLGDVGDTTLWQLLVAIMRHDTDKHIMILKFIRDRAEEG